MLRRVFVSAALSVVAISAFAIHRAEAQVSRCNERPLLCKIVKARLGTVKPEDRVNPPGNQTLKYGTAQRQDLDYWQSKGSAKDAPLVVFIHGGAWTMGDKSSATGSAKVSWFTERGYDFASLNYRLVPDVSVDGEAADVAAAIRFLRSRAAELGFDPNRIILMGHSAGAHLAALVSANDKYLGQDINAVRGTILLDGAAYDVPRALKGAGLFAAKLYKEPFSGLDPAAQEVVSPTLHAAQPNSAGFLIIYDAKREDAVTQSKALGAALTAAGTGATMLPVPNSNHVRINFDVGRDDFETPAIATFLDRQLGRMAAQ